MERVFRRAGYTEMAELHEFELSLDMGYETVSAPQALLAKRLEVMSPILHADGVINLPKFKTHMFMTFTGATKNLFGVIPGLNKASYHARLSDRHSFAEMLLDVAYFVRPRLNIVDGVLALEGDGPGTGGSPRSLGVLLAGADPVTVDVACCRIGGIDPRSVPVLAAAHERGLWSGAAGDVDTLGSTIAELQVSDFALPGSYEGMGVGRLGALEDAARRALRRFNRLPRPKPGRCTACGDCVRACPVDAVSLPEVADAAGADDPRPRVARVDDSLCIRCYCCHEVCPSAAIDLEFTGMGRMMHRLRLI
jgi:ferredoxin